MPETIRTSDGLFILWTILTMDYLYHFFSSVAC